MRVILKKSFRVDGIELNKGDEGWVRGFRFGGDHDRLVIDVGDHKMLLVDRGALEFPKREVKITE